jgi:hypothetical protein
VVFCPVFSAVHRVGPGRSPPKIARTDALSMTARDQSILWARCRRRNSSRCSLRHTPARCHWQRRFQQVIPQPQPISWGKSSQGMPVLSTKRIPVSALRSSKGKRPGWCLRRLCRGSSGRMILHRPSSNNGLAMTYLRVRPPAYEHRNRS